MDTTIFYHFILEAPFLFLLGFYEVDYVSFSDCIFKGAFIILGNF